MSRESRKLAGILLIVCNSVARRILSVCGQPQCNRTKRLIHIAYLGAVLLALALLTLGVGLVRKPESKRDGTAEQVPAA